MLLELAQLLGKDVRVFNVFQYITLRAVLACLTALVISFVVGPAMIRKLVADERPERPLSDQALTVELNNRGINVARRTVAKYREAMNIPSSNDRARLS